MSMGVVLNIRMVVITCGPWPVAESQLYDILEQQQNIDYFLLSFYSQTVHDSWPGCPET